MAFSITTFRTTFLFKLVHAVTKNLIPNANKRFRKYVKSEKTQDQPINSNFEALVNEAAGSTLREMGIEYWVGVTDHKSDTHLETDDFILQLDAKGCLVDDRDFKIYDWCGKNQLGFSGLQVHLGLAQHTRVFSQLLDRDRTKLVDLKDPIQGKQLREIDGKPVHTMVSFLKWGYNESKGGYFADTVGLAEFPHEDDVYAVAGKQKGKELRFIITNPELYSVHKFVAESVPQTQDSAPSSSTEPPAVEPPTQ